MTKNKDYYVIFGGGGIRGVAYVGALYAMKEYGINIKGLSGSSVGAVVAGLLAVGYTTDEIKDLFMQVGLGLFSDINFDLVKGFSFSKGEIFYNWVKELIEQKFYGDKYTKKEMKPVTFGDIDKDLIIMSVNLTDSEFNEFSRHTTPNYEIAKAIRASVSMPGLFQPIEENDNFIADGDLMKSWPMWRLSKSLCPDDCRILEFRLEDMHKSKTIDNILTYLNAVYNTVTGFASKFIMDLYSKKDKFDYIRLNTKDVSVVDFTISKERKEEMIEVGYRTTKDYLEKVLPKKRAELYRQYYGLYMFLLDIEHSIKNKKYKKANEIIGEMFIELCEYKRMIDIEIYNKIMKFKDIFKANYIQTKVGFLELNKIKNEEAIILTLNDTIQSIKDKTLDLKE